jgi:hypothetical protein
MRVIEPSIMRELDVSELCENGHENIEGEREITKRIERESTKRIERERERKGLKEREREKD